MHLISSESQPVATQLGVTVHHYQAECYATCWALFFCSCKVNVVGSVSLVPWWSWVWHLLNFWIFLRFTLCSLERYSQTRGNKESVRVLAMSLAHNRGVGYPAAQRDNYCPGFFCCVHLFHFFSLFNGIRRIPWRFWCVVMFDCVFFPSAFCVCLCLLLACQPLFMVSGLRFEKLCAVVSCTNQFVWPHFASRLFDAQSAVVYMSKFNNKAENYQNHRF